MADPSQNLAVTTLAKGATAQLRELVEVADRDSARMIYAELLRLAFRLSRKHGFALGREKQTKESNLCANLT